MMDKLKFILFSVVVLVLLGLIGYWSIATLQSGTEFQTDQKIKELQQENDDLAKQVATLSSQLGSTEAELATLTKIANPTPEPDSGASTSVTTYKNQDLIDELQKLTDSNTFMKLNAKGAKVGTVQNFLNIYNKTSTKIDNDYGAGTQKRVAAFQKEQGLTADGEAGANTFNKMISWLKKQG